MDRPVTTLFMLMSLDGKISTGVRWLCVRCLGFVDFVDVVVAPVLVGGRDTPTPTSHWSVFSMSVAPELVDGACH